MKTLSLDKSKKPSKAQVKKQKIVSTEKKALFTKSEQDKTQILANEYLQSFAVIASLRLLTLGFSSELKAVYSEFEAFSFSRRQLIRAINNHCNSDKYKELDIYGIRYNIDNIPTHQIVRIDRES